MVIRRGENWTVTGERTRIKNQYVTCPDCGGLEYIVSARGRVAVSGERRGVLLDPSHRCSHCGKAYRVPVEARG